MSSPAPAIDAPLPAPFRVASVREELSDTFTLDLVPAAGAGAFDFLPGQFNMLYVFGVGEAAISISGSRSGELPLTHTVRAVGNVTRAMRRLRAGDVLGVRGPFGVPWPVERLAGADVVIIAGGIGLAPLRPVIHHLLAHRQDFGKICIFAGFRTPEDMLFRRELEEWRGRFDLTVEVTVDRATGDWAGRVGVVTQLVNRGGYDPRESVALVCGPEVMMRYAAAALRQQGVAGERVYVSMERNMKCAVAHCGHCQLGPHLICRDGPVFRYDRVETLMKVQEL